VSCVFCDIWRGEARADVAYKWNRAIAISPLNPVTAGHVLIVPGIHVRDFSSDPETSGYVMKCASEYIDRWHVGQCNIITSVGENATQSVFHLHVHIVPRRLNDGLKLPWSEQ